MRLRKFNAKDFSIDSLDKSRKMATIVFYPPGDLKKSKIDCSIPNLEVLFHQVQM